MLHAVLFPQFIALHANPCSGFKTPVHVFRESELNSALSTPLLRSSTQPGHFAQIALGEKTTTHRVRVSNRVSFRILYFVFSLSSVFRPRGSAQWTAPPPVWIDVIFFFSASPSFLFGRQLHVSQGDFSEVTGSRMVSEARAGWKLCDRERVGAGFSSTDSVDFCCLLETKLTYFLFCFVLFELKVMAERGARVLLSLLCLTSACSLAPARAQKGKCVEVWFGLVWFCLVWKQCTSSGVQRVLGTWLSDLTAEHCCDFVSAAAKQTVTAGNL